MANIERQIGQLSLPSDLGRSVKRGEVLIRDPVNVYEGNLPSAAHDDPFGFVDEIAGGTPGQDLPVRLLRTGEMMVRIQDNATVALYDPLSISTTDPGSVAPNVPGAKTCGIALGTITTGSTDQYVMASVDCISSEARVDYFHINFTHTNIAATSPLYGPPVPHRGRLLQVRGTINDALGSGTDVITFHLGSTAVTGGAITIASGGSPGQTYVSAAITGNDIANIGDAVRATSDGGSVTITELRMTFEFLRL